MVGPQERPAAINGGAFVLEGIRAAGADARGAAGGTEAAGAAAAGDNACAST